MITNIANPLKVLGSKHISYWLMFPKNASTSIKMTLNGCWELNPRDERNDFKWTVVRNPYARLYSCWSDKIQRKRTRGEMLPKLACVFKPCETSFESFCNWVCAEKEEDTDGHWTPQDRILRLKNFNPDVILHFEKLQDDWRALSNMLGLNPVLEKLGRTRWNINDHRAHEHAYNESLCKIVAEYYREDFERFGYPDSL